MKPIYPTAFSSAADQFCLGRMINTIGLITIGIVTDLRAAKARINELTRRQPGTYIVFHRNTGRVVARATSA